MEMKRKVSDNNCTLKNQRKKPNYLTETGFTNCYTSIPRLESIAIIKVVIVLCKQPDVDACDACDSCDPYKLRLCYPYICRDNARVEHILTKLSLLPLPNLIKANMFPVVRPIVIQIIKWLCCIRTNIGYDILDSIGYSTLNSICWTSQGIVNRGKTFKQLIEPNYDSGLLNCNQTAERIYKLACTYCLEDIIPILWEKLSKETKDNYLNSDLYHQPYDKHLILYWCSVNKNESSELFKSFEPYSRYNPKHSISKNMFLCVLDQGNILAVKYFWEKLTTEEIICNLELWIDRAIMCVNSSFKLNSNNYQCTSGSTDVLYFLLSKISTETLKEVIQKSSLLILKSLYLFWPYQRFLLPTIQTMWETLDERDYIDLLYTVAKEINKDTHSETILKKLCCMSPINLKQCLIHHIITHGTYNNACFVLLKLLAIGDMATVKERISYANVEEQKQIAKSIMTLKDFAHELIYTDRLNVVDHFFQESLLSESDIINLKEQVGFEHGWMLCKKWIADNNWEMVEKFLNWAFTSQEKINRFKENSVRGYETISVTYDYFKQGDYECVNRFINWCFCSEQEINQFKKKFALTKLDIVLEFRNDWCLFEKYLVWLSLSEQGIKDFKLTLYESKSLLKTISFTLKVNKNFQFVDKLINWCGNSKKGIQHFKEQFVFLPHFHNVVRGFKNNWELLKKLFILFSPLSEEVKFDVKENIAEAYSFNHVIKRNLLRLIDGYTEDESFDIASSDEISEAREVNSYKIKEAVGIDSEEEGEDSSCLSDDDAEYGYCSEFSM